jgi:hypothetical protein
MIYEDFQLLATNVQVIKSDGKKTIRFQLQVPHSPAGELTEATPGEYDSGQMNMQLNGWDDRIPDWSDVLHLGEWLCTVLFPGRIRQLLENSLSIVQSQKKRLRLRLVLSGELHNVPWEYVLLNRGGGEATLTDFLGLMPDVSIVRHQAATLPAWEVKADLPAQMVAAFASPAGYSPSLKLDQEQQGIAQAINDNPHIQPMFISVATPEKLLAASKPVHLFHFAGHGDFEQKMAAQPGIMEGEGVLILDDGYSDAVRFSAGQLALQLRQAGVRVAVLGACDSGRRDNVNAWSSVATALLKADLGAVVGMQYKIRDDSAIAFAREFYKALATGLPIDEAVTNGRIAIAANDVRGWGTPVLYLRAADGVVFPEYRDDSALESERQQVRLKVQQKVKILRGKLVGIEAGTLKESSDVKQSADTVKQGAELVGIKAREVTSGANVTQEVGTVDGNTIGIKVDQVENIQTGQRVEKVEAGGAVVGVAIGDHVQIGGEQHFHYPPAPNAASVLAQLPPKTYHRFVGRFDERDKVMNCLRDPLMRGIAIVGLGGMGKTALAIDVAEQCSNEKSFDAIVWTSAKTECFVGENIANTNVFAYTFDELLNEIGRQCERTDILQMPSNQKQEAIKRLLANRRVLIVLDNLETVKESEKIVTDVFSILGQGKLLLTSRHHIRHEQMFTLDLGGFSVEDGVAFLREDGKVRGIETVKQAERPVLAEIHQVTGGSPLAMKLVVGQVSRLPLDVVLDTLKKAAPKGQVDPFYRFVYQHSWKLLEMNARMALVDMSVFPPNVGGAVKEVHQISQLDSSVFWLAMDQLVMLSLVDKVGEVNHERYALHPLTQYFIRSDITKELANQ